MTRQPKVYVTVGDYGNATIRYDPAPEHWHIATASLSEVLDAVNREIQDSGVFNHPYRPGSRSTNMPAGGVVYANEVERLVERLISGVLYRYGVWVYEPFTVSLERIMSTADTAGFNGWWQDFRTFRGGLDPLCYTDRKGGDMTTTKEKAREAWHMHGTASDAFLCDEIDRLKASIADANANGRALSGDVDNLRAELNAEKRASLMSDSAQERRIAALEKQADEAYRERVRYAWPRYSFNDWEAWIHSPSYLFSRDAAKPEPPRPAQPPVVGLAVEWTDKSDCNNNVLGGKRTVVRLEDGGVWASLRGGGDSRMSQLCNWGTYIGKGELRVVSLPPLALGMSVWFRSPRDGVVYEGSVSSRAYGGSFGHSLNERWTIGGKTVEIHASEWTPANAVVLSVPEAKKAEPKPTKWAVKIAGDWIDDDYACASARISWPYSIDTKRALSFSTHRYAQDWIDERRDAGFTGTWQIVPHPSSAQ